ncbi:hypothetical protein ABIB40_002598 [Pedobacter sp. UYP30]|uniref:DUF6377 domain-containing protein n=1 Tax=Pedobacter sp. UYP30 TaxID=1756400 RepID=UPI003391937D
MLTNLPAKFFSISLFFVFLGTTLNAQERYATDLNKLNEYIKKKPSFDKQKQLRIQKLETEIDGLPVGNDQGHYVLYLKLYNEYKTYDFKKAFFYSKKLEETGRRLKDPTKIADGKTKMGFILISSGLFKETFDALKSVEVEHLVDSMKIEFYFLNARCYYDLADYDKDDYFAPSYVKRAAAYIDSATMLCDPKSYESRYFNGLKLLKAGKKTESSKILHDILKNYQLTNHQYAVTASTLSDIYIQDNNIEKAIPLLARAAVDDIISSTKEAAAMLNLAQLLYKRNDVKNAYTYINEAMDDANYYGARQRKIQVSANLMVIASGKINSVEGERKKLVQFIVGLVLFMVLIGVFSVIIYRQLLKIRKADKIITETNASLQLTINKLNEAEKIKEEYIGYYFNLISVYLNKLDRFKRSVDNKINAKKFEDIRVLANNINLKKEREELFENFDRAFLTLFPQFVESFNALFDEENQVKLQHAQILNTDLRIFALVRLGISTPEKIASILEYSTNTIYNYKARIKTKSLLDNDEFELAIMAINTI